MSENEKDLIARVERIHRDERRLEKQAKLVERETIWMEKMDAQQQLARSALARARSHEGESADEAVEMAMTRVADLELAMQQLQRLHRLLPRGGTPGRGVPAAAASPGARRAPPHVLPAAQAAAAHLR